MRKEKKKTMGTFLTKNGVHGITLLHTCQNFPALFLEMAPAKQSLQFGVFKKYVYFRIHEEKLCSFSKKNKKKKKKKKKKKNPLIF